MNDDDEDLPLSAGHWEGHGSDERWVADQLGRGATVHLLANCSSPASVLLGPWDRTVCDSIKTVFERGSTDVTRVTCAACLAPLRAQS